MTSKPALRDLNKLNSFVRVAERKSFTKAAQDLRTTPSVVSKHMSELEDALGFALLNRSTHGVVLTEAGEGLLRNCLQMLAGLDGYVTETRNSQTGPYGGLRIHASPGYAYWILAPLITEFARRYPQLRIELRAESSTRNAVEDGCDVIVTNQKPEEPGLVSREIGSIQHVVCASPAYFQREGRPQKPQALRDHNCLVNSFFARKEWPFKQGGREILVEVKGNFSSNSAAILTQVALDGMGIVRVPSYAVEVEIAAGKLEPIFETVTCSHESLRAYYSRTKHLPAKITAFVEYLEQAIG